jgi:hypothetical protein
MNAEHILMEGLIKDCETRGIDPDRHAMDGFHAGEIAQRQLDTLRSIVAAKKADVAEGELSVAKEAEVAECERLYELEVARQSKENEDAVSLEAEEERVHASEKRARRVSRTLSNHAKLLCRRMRTLTRFPDAARVASLSKHVDRRQTTMIAFTPAERAFAMLGSFPPSVESQTLLETINIEGRVSAEHGAHLGVTQEGMVKIRIFHRKNFEECELQVTQGRGANEFNTVYRGEDLPPAVAYWHRDGNVWTPDTQRAMMARRIATTFYVLTPEPDA